MNGDLDANAQHISAPSVPFGLKSISASLRLEVDIYNQRSETVQYWWVNYYGYSVQYGSISSGHSNTLYTFGTHPWLITNQNGHKLITYFVPLTANMNITIK